jgi:alpha-glucosidase
VNASGGQGHIRDRSIRFRYAPEGIFQRDFSYALVRGLDESLVSLQVVQDEDLIYIITEKVICKVEKKSLRICITAYLIIM